MKYATLLSCLKMFPCHCVVHKSIVSLVLEHCTTTINKYAGIENIKPVTQHNWSRAVLSLNVLCTFSQVICLIDVRLQALVDLYTWWLLLLRLYICSSVAVKMSSCNIDLCWKSFLSMIWIEINRIFHSVALSQVIFPHLHRPIPWLYSYRFKLHVATRR